MTCFVAKPALGRELSHLVREIPQPGAISLVYAREPDFFAGLGVQGKLNQVMVFTDAGNTVTSMGVRSLRPLFINGRAREFGYLHGLKTLPGFRNRGEAAKGFLFFRKLHQDRRTPGYLTTIIEDNVRARKMLEKKRTHFPRYMDMGRFTTFALPVRKGGSQKTDASFTITTGSRIPLVQIVNFLNTQGARRQFFPVYNRDDFSGPALRNFNLDHLFVAMRWNRIVGTLGVWDQHAFKQTLVDRYAGLLRYGRPLANLFFRAAGYHGLPGPGQEIRMVYGALICVAENDPQVLRSLLSYASGKMSWTDTHFLVMGFHEQDPLQQALKGRLAIPYQSRLYLVGWDEMEPFLQSLDQNLVPYLETAAL